MKTVILLGHKAQVGKDTLADYLAEHHGFRRLAFATALKDTCRRLFNLTDEQLYGRHKEVPDLRYEKPNGSGACYTSRELMQLVGQNMRSIWPDIWADITKNKILESKQHDFFVISDFRFKNEFLVMKQIENYGNGRVIPIRIERKDRPTITNPNDISEVDLDNFRFTMTIENSGSVEDFTQEASDVIINYLTGNHEAIYKSSIVTTG